MNKLFFVLSLGTILLIGIGVQAQEILDIGQIITQETNLIITKGSLTGFGIDYDILNKENISIRFIIEGAKINIKENLYTNILPERSFRKAYINLNKNLEIIQADFTVDENGGSYTLGDKTYEVPNGTRIYFSNETGIELDFPDGTDLSKFPSLLKYISGSYLTTIKGNDIKIFDGFDLIDGEISIEENGYLLKNGEVNYKQNLLNVNTEENSILIANPNVDISGCNRNSLKQTEYTLEICSSEKGYIKVEFLEDHKILNTDKKDKLIAILSNGDGLKFNNRDGQGLIPSIEYKKSDNGDIKIINGDLTFNVNKDSILVNKPKDLVRDKEYYSKPYQSVAFELEKDSSTLRVNAYGQYVLLSKKTNQRVVTYNQFDLPVSKKLIDNECQDLDCLQKRYPKIKFSIPKESVFGVQNNLYDIGEIHPFMVYYVDEWIKAHPEALDKIEEIGFLDRHGNYNIPGSADIILGEKGIDPFYRDITNDVRNLKPLSALDHEYEHLQNSLVIIRENEINNQAYKRLNDFYNEIITSVTTENSDEIRNKLSEILNEVKREGFVEETGFGYFLEGGHIAEAYDSFIRIAGDPKKDPEIREYSLKKVKELERFIESLGLPSSYSLDEYYDTWAGGKYYPELSATYMEESRKVRKAKVNSANKLVSKTYRKLTQLAFDSGKMDVKDYRYLMGEKSCKQTDCSDKLCVEYKLLCCIDHPESPNC